VVTSRLSSTASTATTNTRSLATKDASRRPGRCLLAKPLDAWVAFGSLAHGLHPLEDLCASHWISKRELHYQ
jgi:hypothetical protein